MSDTHTHFLFCCLMSLLIRSRTSLCYIVTCRWIFGSSDSKASQCDMFVFPLCTCQVLTCTMGKWTSATKAKRLLFSNSLTHLSYLLFPTSFSTAAVWNHWFEGNPRTNRIWMISSANSSWWFLKKGKCWHILKQSVGRLCGAVTLQFKHFSFSFIMNSYCFVM